MGPAVPSEVVVALDAGTTGVKAAAFAPGSRWRRVAVREYPLVQAAPDRQVQDVDTVLAAAAAALAECVASTDGAEVVGLSLSAGMHGLAALDADRRPLTPLITWADARARDEARDLHRTGRAAELYARTGVPVHPMTPLAKLLWFARHDRTVWEAARWWVGLKELLVLWLTGTMATEPSSASGTGLLDVWTGAWSPLAVEACGVAADRLPPIVPSTDTVPLADEVARQVGLPTGTPVVMGAADGPLGNVGTGALAPGVAGLSLGTSGAVRVTVDAPRLHPDQGLFCYALADSLWVVGGAVSNGGLVVRWAGGALTPDLRAAAGEDGIDDAVLALAATAPAGSDGLVMLPYLLAGRAPLWDADLPGAYLGLRREHRREHLLRAAVEGVCMQMRLVLDHLDAVEPVRSVRATGGAFRARLWREVLAAILDRPLHVVDGVDGTAAGAAALGLLALGRAATLADAADLILGAGASVPPPVDVDPQAVATYDRLRGAVPGLVAGLAPVARAFGDRPPPGDEAEGGHM